MREIPLCKLVTLITRALIYIISALLIAKETRRYKYCPNFATFKLFPPNSSSVWILSIIENHLRNNKLFFVLFLMMEVDFVTVEFKILIF